MVRWRLLVLLGLAVTAAAAVGGASGGEVRYDGRSIIVDGQRKLLFSGSIHYPRSTPDMWPYLISQAKLGGLDAIDTYVFWNLHEPQPGQYYFSGRRDIVRFMKEVQSQGLYVCLRIGPFIEAEWSYGGLPFWLHDIPGIVFRSDNEPFKFFMQNFTTKIVNMMKSEKLFASQGGPIIVSQIENEYQNVEKGFGDKGPPYVKWAAAMAVGLDTGVPWVMCKQDDAPDPVINACNGRTCGETFVGPNSPNKPAIWTENWTHFYDAYGSITQIRSPQFIAYHVALFILKKNGSFINYYMYHGGTNFGRNASAYMLTSYYDEAPLDEYGLIRQPKWGHLKELHAAVKLCSQTLLYGTRTNFSLGAQQEVKTLTNIIHKPTSQKLVSEHYGLNPSDSNYIQIDVSFHTQLCEHLGAAFSSLNLNIGTAYVYKGSKGECAAFLINGDNRTETNVKFQNRTYKLPPKSISILPECKLEAFNTAKVSTEYNTRTRAPAVKLNSTEIWQEFSEVVAVFDDTSLRSNLLLEQMNTTKDTSDYLWSTASYHQFKEPKSVVMRVNSRGHVLRAFVNGQLIGSEHGAFRNESFTLEKTVDLKRGANNISLLSIMIGLPDSGAHMERRASGLANVSIEDKFLSNYSWGYQVGLLGEKLQLYTEEGSRKVKWSKLTTSSQPLKWYKSKFDAPRGDEPVALNLGSMGKGEAWINGESIGRYWISFHTPRGSPSQIWYHIPRSFLKPRDNLVVVFEEESGNPLGISVGTVSITKVCGHVSSSNPPLVDSYIKQRGRRPRVELHCPLNKNITKILFASFGSPLGDCNNHAIGRCHSINSTSIVERACVGKKMCSIPLSYKLLGGDPCPRVSKDLLIEAECR